MKREFWKPREVSFDVTDVESSLIRKIVDRAESAGLFELLGHDDRTHLTMDLEATHANGNPMNFEKLLKADNFNFNHDIGGIANCLDRSTGRLTRHFSPRCSAHTPLFPPTGAECAYCQRTLTRSDHSPEFADVCSAKACERRRKTELRSARKVAS